MYPMLDFRLRTFLAVREEGGYSKAAERLGLTQPAVSQHIAHLEERFGVPLFSHKGRTLTLTPPGETLYRYAAFAEAEGRKVDAEVRAPGTALPIRFGATRTIGEYVLPPLLSAYLAQAPQVELSMVVDNTENLVAALRQGKIDFAFIEGIFDRGGLEILPFLTDRFLPVCSASDPLAHSPAQLRELLGRTLILRERGSGSRVVLEQALEARGLGLGSFSRLLELGNLEAIKRLVRDGHGITFLYEQSLRAELDEGVLVSLNLLDFSVSREFVFAFPRQSSYRGSYLGFLEFCRSAAAGPQKEGGV